LFGYRAKVGKIITDRLFMSGDYSDIAMILQFRLAEFDPPFFFAFD
jgi:hypothetical protein